MKHNGNDGKEISIILICSERRTYGSGILNKFFSIGIYNALIGNDRSMDNLCRLINSPRTKKEAKEGVSEKIKKYVDDYGSYTYGVVAYWLNILRIYSIPLCFVGIVIGSIYQYMLGIRKLDVRDKGFALVVTFVTILLICQVLPLIFAIVVNGWRG